MVYGTATMVRDKLLLFGGQQTTDTSFANRFIDTVQVFNVWNLCTQTDTTDTNCVRCSKGTRNTGTSTVTCNRAPQGTYIEDALKVYTNCSAGKYSTSFGAFSADSCIPCPAGYYNPNPGQSNCTACDSGFICPAGASEEVSASSAHGIHLLETLSASGRIHEQNPVPYKAPDIPWFPILFVGVTALILLAIVSVLLAVTYRVWKLRRAYYAPEETQKTIKKVYRRYAKSIRGMSEHEFIAATFDPEFGQHEGSLLEMQQLFQELNVNGIGQLDYNDFLEAFVLLVMRGHMRPLQGSPAEKEGIEFQHWGAALIDKWDLRSFDNFADDHMTAQVGEKILSQNISYSGGITLFFYVMTIILILAIVINFLYNNTTETKASVPRAVIQSSFGTLFQVTSDIKVEVSVIGPVRALSGITSLEGACNLNAALQTCRSSTTVTHTNIFFSKEHGAPSGPSRCYYNNDTQSCTIVWQCTDCYMAEGSTGELLFRLAPQVAATTIDATVTVTTGIRDPVLAFTGKLSMVGGPNQISQVVSRAIPLRSTEVITGMPPSQMFFGLTPSYYEADEIERAVDTSSPTYKSTGYHVRQFNTPVAGNTVPTELFNQYYDAPVLVSMKVDEVPLLVTRTFTQTAVQLITALLGAIAGLSGGLLAAVQFLDQHTGINKDSDQFIHDELEDDDPYKALEEMYGSIEVLMTPEEYKLLRPVIDRGITPQKAAAFLNVLRSRRFKSLGIHKTTADLAKKQPTPIQNEPSAEPSPQPPENYHNNNNSNNNEPAASAAAVAQSDLNAMSAV